MFRKVISIVLAFALTAVSVVAVGAAGEELVSAPAAVLMEASTGKILYEKNPHDKRPCASITKVMTLLLIFEAMDSGRYLAGAGREHDGGRHDQGNGGGERQ